MVKTNCNCSQVCYLCKSGTHPNHCGPVGFKSKETPSGSGVKTVTVDEANKWMKDNGINMQIEKDQAASSSSPQADKSNPQRESTETMSK